MAITYFESERLFKLENAAGCYIFHIDAEGIPVHLHYGRSLADDLALVALQPRGGSSFAPYPEGSTPPASCDYLLQEYSGFGAGDFRIGAARIRNSSGAAVTAWRYRGHSISAGKPELPGLPCSRGAQETLELILVEEFSGVELHLFYSLFADSGVIARSARIVNTSTEPVTVERAMSLQLDLPRAGFDFIHLDGDYFRERLPERAPLHNGVQSVQSLCGSSSHRHNPVCALLERGGGEFQGEVYGAMLAYSGSFRIEVEVDHFETVRLLAGIHPDSFAWHLAPGESFQTPECFLVYSATGLDGMSQEFHHFLSGHLIRSPWCRRSRPVLVNSWEAAYFDFDAERLLAMAKHAAADGIELFVLDDGWFGRRNDDTSSLGDWYVNTDKIGVLKDLVDRINALGLKFGLWFEPEMVSEKSELYAAHPDWVLHVPGRPRSLGRNQMVLDFSREEVVEHLFRTIAGVLDSANIEYIKWDMNRYLTEVYSAALPPERQGEVGHRYVLGVYRLHSLLMERYPNLLIEGCSGGGGRFDAGMLCYVPQIWCSDNTDPIARVRIQNATSLFYPPASQGAHVAVSPNHGSHAVSSFETRGNVAFAGTFGYELDLGKLSSAEHEMIRRQVADFHACHDLVDRGDFHRLTDVFSENSLDAWIFVSPERDRARLTVVRRRFLPHPPFTLLRLAGLDPARRYRVTAPGFEWTVGGDTLMGAGLALPRESLLFDGASMVFDLSAVR